MSTERHLKVVQFNWEATENDCITGLRLKVFSGVNMVTDADVYSIKTVNNTVQRQINYHII